MNEKKIIGVIAKDMHNGESIQIHANERRKCNWSMG